MIKLICITITVGIVTGYLFEPSIFIEYQGILVDVLLCIMLFTIGLELGKGKNPFGDVKRLGVKILLIPLMGILGTLIFGILGGLPTGIAPLESMAVSAGFGWYSLGPALIADYSAQLSAVAFLCNVIRETLGILLVPIVAQKIGYLECVVLPGVSSMDVCLPIIEKSTGEHILIYSVLTGASMCILMPLAVPFFISLQQMFC